VFEENILKVLLQRAVNEVTFSDLNFKVVEVNVFLGYVEIELVV
jgi:hypothetical protein